MTALGATASNPATILSWAAIFTAASAATHAPAAGLLLAGVGLGSLMWVTALTLITAAARRTIGPRAVRAADGITGVGLLGYAGVLGYRTVHDR